MAEKSLAKLQPMIEDIESGAGISEEYYRQIAGRLAGVFDFVDSEDPEATFGSFVEPNLTWAMYFVAGPMLRFRHSPTYARKLLEFLMDESEERCGGDHVRSEPDNVADLRRIFRDEDNALQKSYTSEQLAAQRLLPSLKSAYRKRFSTAGHTDALKLGAQVVRSNYKEATGLARFYDDRGEVIATGEIDQYGRITYRNRLQEVIAHFSPASASIERAHGYGGHLPDFPNPKDFRRATG